MGMTRIADILRRIPGVVDLARLDDEQRRTAAELEARFTGSSALPVKNLGVALLGARNSCFVLLKDGGFRPPKVPTVFLVEEGAREDAAHVIVVEGSRYAVVGEEVIDDRAPYDEAVIPIDKSFVIFPDRRSGSGVPCTFILPPIPFPELEREAETLGISGIISISPSLATDMYLREKCGFPPTNALATLLIGFNLS
jgi:hypothetical protein